MYNMLSAISAFFEQVNPPHILVAKVDADIRKRLKSDATRPPNKMNLALILEDHHWLTAFLLLSEL
jgi:hypothetical protein